MSTITLDADLSRRLESLGARDDASKTRLAREVLRQALPLVESPLATDELEALEAAFARQVQMGIDSGPPREWTDDDWERLLEGERRHPPVQDSWAVPPPHRRTRTDRDR